MGILPDVKLLGNRIIVIPPSKNPLSYNPFVALLTDSDNYDKMCSSQNRKGEIVGIGYNVWEGCLRGITTTYKGVVFKIWINPISNSIVASIDYGGNRIDMVRKDFDNLPDCFQFFDDAIAKWDVD